ncbi:DUF1501 domain-containing protein [Cecembia lonarensis]|uniref:Tat (Twin-arginine translocation) pathway signal sequence n=1 Tax=Cecembia lonarensis (strain CCUG 58316 / KCTC 22772 / LW9) TaxID=1225176 RepID=K1KZZ4_CECL9|nr:DUF1501 domain-containing protein [Cecembia lonarensis]EKB48101.1 hypothetical protein B879_03298 [Cecembia lonarensis LW9]
MNKHLKRRDFLKKTSAAAMATMAMGSPLSGLLSSCQSNISIPSTADSVILLFMAGGMAHTETFDPKKHTAFRKGMHSSEVLSTFPSVPTVLDGIHFSEGLESIGKIMDRGTLIRSYVAADLGHILHTRHQYHWHTCYEPPQSVVVPHIGSWIAKELGPLNPVIPPFINIGQRFTVGEGEELKAFHSAGFLGAEFGPFLIPDPTSGLESVRPPVGMSLQRFEARNQLYENLIQDSPMGEFGSDYQKESLKRSMEQAYILLNSPEAKAFDLSQEPKESYDVYNTGRFGLGCLLAKRLVNQGARFISVTTEYEPFFGWDTHDNGHTRLKDMKKLIDAPIAQLIKDLDESGRLERTLVIVASEFSRDMLTEGRPDLKVLDQVDVPEIIEDMKNYGMHRHFTDGCSILMFGGGIKRGHVYGKTADERPCKTIEKPIKIERIHQTIYHALGIAPDTHYLIEKRPFYTTPDGHGQVEFDLLKT